MLWGKCDSLNVTENRYKKGKVVWGKSVQTLLNEMRIDKDFDVKETIGKDDVAWIHRRTSDADIYFVSNQKNQQVNYNCIFRTEGKIPELWNAETAATSDAAIWKNENKRTTVLLNLKPLESVFVVFRRPSKNSDPVASFNAKADSSAFLEAAGGHLYLHARKNGDFEIATRSNKKYTSKVTNLPQPIEVAGSWTVSFPPNWGAPSKIEFPKLISWTEHSDKGVNYFSGTATYSNTFHIPAEMVGENKLVKLDLGEVKNFAGISINSKEVGLLWKTPFVIDITNYVVVGENHIDIKITNTWANRMIGDEQEPPDVDYQKSTYKGVPELYNGVSMLKFPEWFINGEQRPSKGRYTFSTYNNYRKENIPLPSGLLGPVRIVNEARIEIY